MTPAIDQAEQLGLTYRIHRYEADKHSGNWGREAAEQLGLDPARVFKTLVVKLDDRELAVAVIPVECRLDMKRLARAFGARKAAMAEATEVTRSSGYVLGGVSPLGQKRKLRTLIDNRARELDRLYVSAGRRGLEIELAPQDLLQATGASWAQIARAE